MTPIERKFVGNFLSKLSDKQLLEMFQEVAPMLSDDRLRGAIEALKDEQNARSQRRLVRSGGKGKWL